MEVKWKDGRDDASLVSEGTVIKPDDFRALVKVNGTEDEEKKREFESSILKNLILVTPDEKRLEFKSEYKIPAGSAVFIEIDSKLNVIDNLIEDFDKKSTEEQNRIRQEWEDYKLTPCPNGGLKIGIVKKTVSPDDEYSALDTRMKIVPYTEDTPIVMTMVKGQSCTFGNDSKGNWESSDPKKLSVNKKTGKVTAKGVTGDEEVILKDNVGNKEYHINIENPRIYLRQESEETGKTQYSIPANTITLTTGEDEYIYLDLMQDNSGDTAKEPKSLSTVNTAWISANPKIAEVTDNGKVTGVGKGSTKISGYVNGKAYSVTVKVTDVYSAATGNPKVLGQNRTSTEKPFEDTVFMNPGTTYTLKYDKKSGFNPKKGYWKTLDQEGKVIEENAPVTIDGKKAKVTAVKTGTVVFEGYATEEALKNDDQGPAVSLTVICRALPAKTVTYLNDASTAKKAPSEILKFYKVTNKKADQWISGNTEIATVDEKTGKVTAGTLKEAVWGYSDITCRNKDSVYKTRVYIEKPDVVWPETEDRIKINSKANTYDLELKAGEQFLISTPYVKQSLLWKSSKPGVAFVSEKGVIEGVAAGNNGKDAKAVVTAKVNGTQVKINVTVKSR